MYQVVVDQFEGERPVTVFSSTSYEIWGRTYEACDKYEVCDVYHDSEIVHVSHHVLDPRR